MDVNTILIIVLILSNLIVGFILKNQIKSQNEKIKNLELLNKSFRDYAELFDINKIKNYIELDKELRDKETELIRRKIIKETTERITKEYSANIDKIVPVEMNIVMNEVVNFLYWFFTKKDKGVLKEQIRNMFPESHEYLLSYFNEIDKISRNSK
jgi:predicted PurR-regulated permease PerM